jgi:RNA polymerase sigma-70 factor, ECF subfamily
MNPIAINSIVKQYGQYLNQTALYLTRNEDDAKDLVQDVFLKLCKIHLKHDTYMKTFLYTVLMNTFRDKYRSNKSDKNTVDGHYLAENASKVAYNDGEANLEEGDVINKVFERLPEQYVAIVALLEQGFKYEEIAERFGMPVGTIKNKIFKIRERLKHIQPVNKFKQIA